MGNDNKRRYKDLSKNTVLFAISSFGTKILTFFLVPLYTNVLSTSEYGTADLLYTTTTLLIVVFTINISDGVLIFSMDKKQNPVAVLSFGIKVILGGWGILTLVETMCYMLGIFRWPAHYFIFISFFFVASALYDTLSNFLRAIDKVKEVTIAGVISSVTYLLCNILLLLVVKNGLNGYLISTVTGPLAGVIYCFLVSHVQIAGVLKGKISDNQKQAILKFCIPLIFNSLALWVNSCLDRYFITFFCGVGQNGIYSVASKIPVILSTTYTVFTQAWTLSAVKEFDKDDKDGFFSNTYDIYIAAMSIACSGLVLMNVPLAHILYAKDFFVAWKYSSVLLLGIYCNSLAAFTGRLFSAVKNSGILASTTVASAVINTILNILLIPRFGVQGAAIATAIALAAMWIIRTIKLGELISIRINWPRDMVVLVLLITQIILEHIKDHMYIAQCIIFFFIVVLMINPFVENLRKLFAERKRKV